ncbi:MAG: response regulator [Elusimicrobia bacterium]|nr:response regulator [Elusimicrobiota bacterium]
MLKRKILVVDDDVYVRNAVMTALKTAGHFVLGAQSGKTALSIFGKFDFDMVITDYEMEDVGGLNLIKKVKAEKPDIFVIMMTAFPSRELSSRVLKYENAYFLCKPIKVDKLRELVESCFRKKEIVRENILKSIHKENTPGPDN